MGSNNGMLAVACRALGDRIGVHHSAAARAIRELENAGFLVSVKASSFSNKRLAAEYRLTHLKCNVTGDLASREFALWRPAENVESKSETTKPLPST